MLGGSYPVAASVRGAVFGRFGRLYRKARQPARMIGVAVAVRILREREAAGQKRERGARDKNACLSTAHDEPAAGITNCRQSPVRWWRGSSEIVTRRLRRPLAARLGHTPPPPGPSGSKGSVCIGDTLTACYEVLTPWRQSLTASAKYGCGDQSFIWTAGWGRRLRRAHSSYATGRHGCRGAICRIWATWR